LSPPYQPGFDVDNFESTGHDRQWRADLGLLAAAGVSRTRYPVGWHRIERAPGRYDWRETDASLGWARCPSSGRCQTACLLIDCGGVRRPRSGADRRGRADPTTNPYGASSWPLTLPITAAAAVHRIGAVSLRYFSVAGAEDGRGERHDPETHLIPLALEATTEPGHVVYNLGNGTGLSVRDVIDTARRVTGIDIRAEEVDRRAGDPAVLVASSKRIRSELGWEPQKPDLAAMISDAWEFARSRPS
jgi:hypothetical protein